MLHCWVGGIVKKREIEMKFKINREKKKKKNIFFISSPLFFPIYTYNEQRHRSHR